MNVAFGNRPIWEAVSWLLKKIVVSVSAFGQNQKPGVGRRLKKVGCAWV